MVDFVLMEGTGAKWGNDHASGDGVSDFLYQCLLAKRHACICATDAIQLMERHKEAIDLVLTDVLMPGMKGRELVERLAELQSDMKVLYMSAYTEDAAVNIGVLDPGTQFIEKPFSPDDLAGKVREVLGRAPTIPQ